MKHGIIMTALLAVAVAATATAQLTDDAFTGAEPGREEIGVPLYPDATFIRVTASLDPFYESAMYVTEDEPGAVRQFYADNLENARMVTYEEENENAWAFLLQPRVPLEDYPDRNDLTILDHTPNIQVKRFKEVLYLPLIEYMESKDEYASQVTALRDARTFIRYTYRKQEDEAALDRIAGTWRCTDRDLPRYLGSVLTLTADNTYTWEFTEQNVASIAEKKAAGGTGTAAAIQRELTAHNPETGVFSVLRNTITLETDNPVVGDAAKSGLVEPKNIIMSMQLINTPRLTFMRIE